MKKGLLIFIISFLGIHQLSAQVKRTFTLSQFTFEDTAGKKFNLDSLKGKVVFVDCWFPACPPCRAEMPYSQLLQKRLHTMAMDSNIVFVTIDFMQTKTEWFEAMKKLPMPQGIHLYSPASTYEMTIAGGNYPTYRIFNSKGILDIEYAPRPSDFGKIDFVLFAASRGVEVTKALSIYELNKNEGLLQKFNAVFSKHAGDFKKEFDGLKAK